MMTATTSRSEAHAMRRMRARPALGTLVEIDACVSDAARIDDAIDAAFAVIEEIEVRMSPRRYDSDVARIVRAEVGTPITIDAMTSEVLAMAHVLHRESDGLFDCATDSACDALAFIAPFTVVKKKSLRIDFGGIAKGYAVDRAVMALVTVGCTGGCVNAGGDLRVFGTTTRRVDLRDPRDPMRRIPLIDLHDAALATSANYFFAGALVTPDRCMVRREAFDAGASVSVRAPSGMLADALTKIVALSGDTHHPLLSRYSAEAIIVARDAA